MQQQQLNYPCIECTKNIPKNQCLFSCLLCQKFAHKKCRSSTPNNSSWYCSKCLATIFPFNNLNDADFYIEANYMKIPEIVDHEQIKNLYFNPFTHDDKVNLNDEYIDPDVNFYNTIINHKCSYYIEDQLNKAIDEISDINLFSIFHLNCRSMSKNYSTLSQYLKCINHQFSIIAVSETWLSNETEDIFPLDNYTTVFKSRHSNRGGGVGFYIRNDINFKIREDISIFEDNLYETLFVEIDQDLQKNIIIGVLYRPPGNDIKIFQEKIDLQLSKLSRENKICYIAGDFNLNLLNCESHQHTSNFFNSMISSSFYPLINKPTRITNTSATLIDNIFTNNITDKMLTGIMYTDISDHLPIFLIASASVKHRYLSKNIYKHDYRKRNIDKFTTELNEIDWCDVYNLTDPKAAYSIFIKRYLKLYNKTFPLRKTTYRRNPDKPWITQGFVISCKKKNTLYREYLHTKTDLANEKYKKYKNKLKHLIKIAEKQHYATQLTIYKGNLKQTWKIIKHVINKEKTEKYLPTEFVQNDSVIKGDQKIANAFNNFFVNIGPNLGKNIPEVNKDFNHYMKGHYNNSIFLTPIDGQEISNIISAFKSGKSSGYDGISPSIVKETSTTIISPLVSIFNKSICTGIVPDQLKIAKITPIYKSGEKKQFSNYRPISVLPCFSKVLERLIYNRLYSYISKNKILYSKQYGFRQNHSTEMALIELVDQISQSNDDKQFTIGIFIDLSKAFDTINHELLLKKLNYYGIRGLPLKWFANYLTNRKQYLSFNTTESTMETIVCGVPQGSILGPLLFILYINDLANTSNLLQFIIFADDTNIFYTDKNFRTMLEITNKELEKVSLWFKINKLSLNTSKTQFIIFCNKSKNYHRNQSHVYIDEVDIRQVNHTKFLGVTIDETLNWEYHLANINNKLSKNIGILYRIKSSLPTYVLPTIYNSLILPYLQYCNIVWACKHTILLNKVFITQKKAIRIVTRSNYYDHTAPLFSKLQQLNIFDINKLQVSTFMFRYYKKDLPDSFENYFKLNSQLHTYNTRQKHDYHIIKSRTNTRLYSLKCQGPRIWNSTDPKLKSLKTVPHFTRCYKKMLLQKYEA